MVLLVAVEGESFAPYGVGTRLLRRGVPAPRAPDPLRAPPPREERHPEQHPRVGQDADHGP